MFENKISVEPKLELNKNKDFDNINGIIIEKIKAGKGAIINIINNNQLSKEEKIHLLQRENENLIGALYELKDKIKEIENKYNYQEYIFYTDASDGWRGINFEKILSQKGVTDYNRKINQLDQYQIYYYVNKKEWQQFLECITKYEIKVLNINHKSSKCIKCIENHNKYEEELNDQISSIYAKYRRMLKIREMDEIKLKKIANYKDIVELDKLKEFKHKNDLYAITDKWCDEHKN